MRNPDRQTTFRFKQFSVTNSLSAMKVGTDAVLLGAWVLAGETMHSPGNILDIGTGSGVLALMMAQRFPFAAITAIDIDSHACTEAQENFYRSPWSNRLACQNIDFLDFMHGGRNVFDLIICNPPFFNNGALSGDTQRMTARHDTSLPLTALINHAAHLLSDRGILALILPADREKEALEVANSHQLWPKRICRVTTTPAKPPRRVMMELCRFPIGAPTPFTSLSIHDSKGEFTEDYIDLTHDFYLNF